MRFFLLPFVRVSCALFTSRLFAARLLLVCLPTVFFPVATAISCFRFMTLWVGESHYTLCESLHSMWESSSLLPFYKEEGTFTEWVIRFDKTSKPHHWTTLELHLSGSDSGNPRALLLSVGASRAAVWVPCRERARVGERHLPRSHVLHTLSVQSRPTVRDAVTR